MYLYSPNFKTNIRNFCLFLMFVFSSLFPSNVKIQLNESFDFIGLNNYETNFKTLLAEQKQKLEETMFCQGC